MRAGALDVARVVALAAEHRMKDAVRGHEAGTFPQAHVEVKTDGLARALGDALDEPSRVPSKRAGLRHDVAEELRMAERRVRRSDSTVTRAHRRTPPRIVR